MFTPLLLALPFNKITAIAFLLLLLLVGFVLLISRLFRLYIRSQDVEAPFLGLVIMAMGILAFFTLWFGFAYEDPAHYFLLALSDSDEAVAFGLLGEELQNEIGGPDGFAVWADDWQPERWYFWSSCSTFNMARINGSGRLTNQQDFGVNFHMRWVEDAWLIEGIEFDSSELSFQAGTLNEMDCDI